MIGLQDTNYRRCIPAAERLPICLRRIAGNVPPGAQWCVWGSSLCSLQNVWRTKILHSEFCVGSRRIDRGASRGWINAFR
ncbi:hypothetical protein AMECASPLE_019019 [Ameca splendens]|uniref:Uncharacterized protein n=1 Tax=Ameca splendens TaxID=208324 RepID=A0ABV0ZZL8_9TELE